MPSRIDGTVSAWDGSKGSVKSETSSSQDKEFWFDKSNLAVMRYSGAYEPKVGDYVTSMTVDDDESRVAGIMESIR